MSLFHRSITFHRIKEEKNISAYEGRKGKRGFKSVGTAEHPQVLEQLRRRY